MQFNEEEKGEEMEGKLDLQSINQLKLDNRIVNILFQNDVKQIEVQLMGLALKGGL